MKRMLKKIGFVSLVLAMGFAIFVIVTMIVAVSFSYSAECRLNIIDETPRGFSQTRVF